MKCLARRHLSGVGQQQVWEIALQHLPGGRPPKCLARRHLSGVGQQQMWELARQHLPSGGGAARRMGAVGETEVEAKREWCRVVWEVLGSEVCGAIYLLHAASGAQGVWHVRTSTRAPAPPYFPSFPSPHPCTPSHTPFPPFPPPSPSPLPPSPLRPLFPPLHPTLSHCDPYTPALSDCNPQAPHCPTTAHIRTRGVPQLVIFRLERRVDSAERRKL
eukprot:361260-Chlamydomonas_euryale.AAC.4